MRLNKILPWLVIYIMAGIVFTVVTSYGFEMLMGPNDLARTIASVVIGFTAPIGLLTLIELHAPPITAKD